MIMTNSTFIFNLGWYTVLLEYPAEVRFEVYEAIMRYASSGTLPELKPLAKMAFSFIKKEMDYNRERYENTVEKRRQAGKSGAEAKKAKKEMANLANAANVEQTEQDQAKQANASVAKSAKQNKQMLTKDSNVGIAEQTEQDQAKQAHNVNDNVNVNDNIFLERVNAGVKEIRDAYLNIFFSPEKQISLDKLLKKWETSTDELTKVCEEVLDDWTHEEMKHTSVEEAKRYFYNAVRYKYSILKTAQNGSKQGKSSGKGSRSSGARDTGPRRNALDSQPKPGYSLDG
ncbi:MAG: hypothetical protein K2H22_04400 [Muribaculaceae bacterium]|nr:hypothetical protein [Muribaculaceae bacterium]